MRSHYLRAAAGGSSPVVPFQLTLNASDNSRLGDTTSVQNTWWGTQTYDAGFVTNIGQQSYQGFYAFTAGKEAVLTATLGGASGWGNGRGRSITATFSIAVDDRIVFFAGKPSYAGGNTWGDGGGGGASCLMKYGTSLSGDADYENGFVPLIIAAGGGSLSVGYYAAAPSAFPSGLVELAVAAPPLSVTTGNTSAQIMAVRNNYPAAGLVAKGGGAGRNAQNTGGCGWIGPSRESFPGSPTDTPNAVGLAYGALGNEENGSGHSAGGFGGGGRTHNNNSYQPGAGGYYGGCETKGSESAVGHTEYTVWQANNILEDNRYGALSFVHSSGSNVTDNGLYGSGTFGSNQNAQQNKGRVYLSFTAPS